MKRYKCMYGFSSLIHVTTLIFILASNEWIWYPSLPNRNKSWMWTGAVTNSSFSLTIRGKIGSTLEVSSSQSGNMVYNDTIDDEVVRVDLTGLESETLYTYRVGNEVGSVRTFASSIQSKLRVALSSCGFSGSTSNVYSEIANQNVDLFLHQGDMHYEDITVNQTERFLDAFDIVHASFSQTELFRSVPFVYMYDDHDFGPNDCDSTSASRQAAIKNYRRCVPHYTLQKEGQDEALYHAFTVGRVRFVIPDLKAEMLNDGEMMSSEQMHWFLSEIRNAHNYALVVLALGVPWNSDSSGWGAHSEDRATISQTILEMYQNHTSSSSSSLGGHANIIGIAGDAHMLAFDDGTNSHGEIPIIQAAPLEMIGSAKIDVTTSGCYGYSASFNSQYAIMEITDSGNSSADSICIHLELRRAGVSNALYETSFCGPFINSTMQSGISTKCELDWFPTGEAMEFFFISLFFILATCIVISRWVWRCLLRRNRQRVKKNRRCLVDEDKFLLWNLLLGYIWLFIEALVLLLGLVFRGFKTRAPVYLARTGLILFVPLTLLFVVTLILVRRGEEVDGDDDAIIRDRDDTIIVGGGGEDNNNNIEVVSLTSRKTKAT